MKFIKSIILAYFTVFLFLTISFAFQISFNHTDHLGSLSISTDSSGSIGKEVQYYPYGELLNSSGTYETNYLYTNQELDPESGLYYYKTRYYDPDLARFISVDPIKDGLNVYAYVENNPLIFVDPSGKQILGQMPPDPWSEYTRYIDQAHVGTLDNVEELTRTAADGIYPLHPLNREIVDKYKNTFTELYEGGNLNTETIFTCGGEEGLDQSIKVVKGKSGDVLVQGHHRFQALRELIDEGKLPKDFRVPAQRFKWEKGWAEYGKMWLNRARAVRGAKGMGNFGSIGKPGGTSLKRAFPKIKGNTLSYLIGIAIGIFIFDEKVDAAIDPVLGLIGGELSGDDMIYWPQDNIDGWAVGEPVTTPIQ